MRKVFLLTAATLLVIACSCKSSSQPQKMSIATPTSMPATKPVNPVITAQQTHGTPDERADQILAEMTQDEKIGLISGGPGGFSTKPISRLGIAAFYMCDGPAGVRNGPGNPPPRACAFPAGVALAATWDPDLATAFGRAIGLEARARGGQFQLGPGVNICRIAVNGRNFEYFGEDPYLTSLMAVNWLKACTATGVVPTIKHFAANNQETNRNSVDAKIDERVLNEIYLPAFKKAVQEAGNIAVMCSYNRLNDIYASNNDWLLNQTLKRQWGFAGLVMSDWGASHQTSDLHKGLDLEMPSPQNFRPDRIKSALAAGSVQQADLDSAVHRILRTAFAEGWLDDGWQRKDSSLPLDSADSSKVALDVAEASVVLLKNDHEALPLDREKVKTIIVTGPNAAAATPTTMPLNIGGGGSGSVTPFDDHFMEAEYLHGITQAAGENVKIVHLAMPAVPTTQQYATIPNVDKLTLTVQVLGDGDPVQLPPTTRPNIDITWQPGQLPFGVPAGRDAIFTWTGTLTAPTDGDWQIHTGRNPTVTIDNKKLEAPDGTIIHLTKDKPTPIEIQVRALANPPTSGRGNRNRFRNNTIRFTLTPPLIPNLDQVSSADAVIVCVGFNRQSEAEDSDRPFELPQLQQYLINAVGNMNPRTIVINNSGGGIGMTGWADHAAAIVQAWYLGQEGGVAIGKILFGDVNPSGHLVATFDKHFDENPAAPYYPGAKQADSDYPIEPYTEGLFYGYRGYDKLNKAPLFPFGHGLSYTTFEFSNLKLEKSGSDVKVSLDVKNMGTRTGAEVVQIYVGEQSPKIERPLRELKSFDKVNLNASETKHIELTLPRDAFAYWNPSMKDWTVDSGSTFTIEAGDSERDIKLKGTIVLP